MKIYQYETEEQYWQAQEEANIKKLNKVWVQRITIEKIKTRIPQALTILCHGTRNAAEQKYFKEFYPSAEILGTEISKTATQFPMTVQWDFRKENVKWRDNYDIVYSNAFDHSNCPAETLDVWKNQVKHNGVLVIEHGYTSKDNRMRKSDPLEISLEELEKLFVDHELNIIDYFDSYGLSKSHKCRVYLLKK